MQIESFPARYLSSSTLMTSLSTRLFMCTASTLPITTSNSWRAPSIHFLLKTVVLSHHTTVGLIIIIMTTSTLPKTSNKIDALDNGV